MISPASLEAIHHEFPGCREEWLNDVRLNALKTWLGKRYDRPAVPPELVPLARAIADAVHANRRNWAVDDVRDIFAQFEGTDPIRVSLFGMIEDDGDRAGVERLLADVAQAIPADLGIVDIIEVGTTTEISFGIVENSVVIDTSDLTWRDDGRGGPH
jgi:hypothetical protein